MLLWYFLLYHQIFILKKSSYFSLTYILNVTTSFLFQLLKSFSDELKTKEDYSSSEGDKDVNKKKNRYKEHNHCWSYFFLFFIFYFINEYKGLCDLYDMKQIQYLNHFFFSILTIWILFGKFKRDLGRKGSTNHKFKVLHTRAVYGSSLFYLVWLSCSFKIKIMLSYQDISTGNNIGCWFC